MTACLIPENSRGRVVGFIDLGSNSLRLLVARITPGGAVRVLNEAKHMVRLGEGAMVAHELQPEAMGRTMDTLCAFAAMCKSYGVEDYSAVATAAVRDAANGEAFLAEVREKTGIDMMVISGREEARLIWRGVSHYLEKSADLRMYLDIGGGSTEMIAASSGHAEILESLKIGCVRLSNLFPTGKKAVTQAQYEAMKMYVRNEGVHAFRRLAGLNLTELVASSGTAQNLAEIACALTGQASAAFLTYSGLCQAVEELRSRPREKRLAVPGLNPKRLDVIIPGAAILQTVLEEMSFKTIRISSRGLRDGMVREYVERNCHRFSQATTGIREQSVLRLARSCRFEEKHSRHVSDLALSLFDSAKKLGLHALDGSYREYLHFASLLHDAGIFISFAKHNEHSHYLVSNTELLGFAKKEVRIIAAMTLLHRAKSVDKYLPKLQDAGSLEAVQTASLFLALAEAMDKGHSAVVDKAVFVQQGKKIVLSASCTASAPLEKARTARLDERMQQVLGRKVSVVFLEPANRTPA